VHPFENVPLAQVLEARKDENLAPLGALVPEAPSYLTDIIMQALTFNAQKRFPTAEAFLKACLLAKSKFEASAPRQSAPPRPVRTVLETKPTAMPQPKLAGDSRQLRSERTQVGEDARISRRPKAGEKPPLVSREAVPQTATLNKREAAAPLEKQPVEQKPEPDVTAKAERPSACAAEQPLATRARKRRRRRKKGKSQMAPQGFAIGPTNTAPKAESYEEIEEIDLDDDEDWLLDEEPAVANPAESAKETIKPVTENPRPVEKKPEPAVTAAPSQPRGRMMPPGAGSPFESSRKKETPYSPPVSPQQAPMREAKPEPRPAEKKEPGEDAAATAHLSAEKLEQVQNPSGSDKSEDEAQDAYDKHIPNFQAAGPANTAGGKKIGLAEQAQEYRRMNSTPKSNNNVSQQRSFKLPKMPNAIMIAAVAVGILIVHFGCKAITHKSLIQYSLEVLGLARPQNIIPAVENADFSFPNLPSGMYSGKITNLVPTERLPLSIISFAERGELIFIVGTAGWTPTAIALKEAENGELRLRTNGFVLKFAGQNSNGVLSGTFANLVTEEEGTWQVQPIK
jgi:hypothetical protein